jgi:hypothetical protein
MAAVTNPSSIKSLLSSRYGPWILVLAVGLLAMGGALRADFYMDDYGFILNQKGTAPVTFHWQCLGFNWGDTSPGARPITLFQTIPSLITMAIGALFPANPVAAHAVNLAIHLALAMLVFGLGQRLLGQLKVLPDESQRRRAALLGALIFACHPLGTEPVHYAKCHMVQLVALFGFWATVEGIGFFRAPGKRTGLMFLLPASLCALSYYPGFVLMVANAVVLTLFFAEGRCLTALRAVGLRRGMLHRPAFMAGLALALTVLGAAGHAFYVRFQVVLINWGDMFGTHFATQGRVFWEYVRRIFVPTGLSSDHYQPWSTLHDPEAVLKLALFAVLFGGVAWFALRRGNASQRGVALLFWLALIPFAMRLLYVNIEIMVEYRAYHALPWISLLAGCGLSVLSAKMAPSKLRLMPAAALILVFTLVSAGRGMVWRSPIGLALDVLEQYPLNNRARNQVQNFLLRSGQFAGILQCHEEILSVYQEILSLNRELAGRKEIDTRRAEWNLMDSYGLAIYAHAELEGCLKAIAFADQSISSLKTQLPGQFKPVPGQALPGVYPVYEAKVMVERVHAAGLHQSAGHLEAPAIEK